MRAISPERARRTFMPSATLPAFIMSFRGFVRIGASAIGSSYFAVGGPTLNSSARWCFQNFAMPVVPWPRVSSLAGMST